MRNMTDRTGRTGRTGRVLVRSELAVPGHPENFVIGDTARTFLHGARLLIPTVPTDMTVLPLVGAPASADGTNARHEPSQRSA